MFLLLLQWPDLVFSLFNEQPHTRFNHFLLLFSDFCFFLFCVLARSDWIELHWVEADLLEVVHFFFIVFVVCVFFSFCSQFFERAFFCALYSHHKFWNIWKIPLHVFAHFYNTSQVRLFASKRLLATWKLHKVNDGINAQRITSYKRSREIRTHQHTLIYAIDTNFCSYLLICV